jgi:hypothetical protein
MKKILTISVFIVLPLVAHAAEKSVWVEITQLRHLEGAKTYSTCRLETRLFSLRCLYCSVLYI